MKLWLKQTLFSLRLKYMILDEQEQICYTAEGGRKGPSGLRIILSDAEGKEIACVSQKNRSFLPVFTIARGGAEPITVRKHISAMRQTYETEPSGWTVDGDFSAHEYFITDQEGAYVAKIFRRWISAENTVELDMAKEEDQVAVIGIALVISLVMAQAKNV